MASVGEASGYFDPFRLEHYNDKKIVETYGQGFLQAHLYSMKNAIPDLYIRGQNLYMSALKEALHVSLEGKVPVESAMNRLSEKWDAMTQKFGRDQQRNQWRFLLNQYPSPWKIEG